MTLSLRQNKSPTSSDRLQWDGTTATPFFPLDCLLNPRRLTQVSLPALRFCALHQKNPWDCHASKSASLEIPEQAANDQVFSYPGLHASQSGLARSGLGRALPKSAYYPLCGCECECPPTLVSVQFSSQYSLTGTEGNKGTAKVEDLYHSDSGIRRQY